MSTGEGMEATGGWTKEKALEAESGLRRLAGVQGAEVELGEEGRLERIHVVARPGHSPKRIVRDVQSLLATLLRIRVDHKRISVVVADVETAGGRRAKIRRVEHLWEKDAARASVELSLLGRMGRGHATDAPSHGGRLRAGVTATLRAIGELFPKERLALEEVRSFRIDGEEAVGVVIYRNTGSIPEYRFGAAYVEGQLTRGAVKATLNALNERLEEAEIVPAQTGDEESGIAS